ncbi:glucosylglycerol 3-phosphatase [Nitrogeniibacter mangrovi]|uniref:Glucosylglycerol 3-phosphatase n=1 Tax=Nitrogeniibacter mangrovi TaxID=2016596 RepID=A0A6C1B4E3_9RHOO|nr:glucosylglycerol 3-phosphatase [Nitrogeniibacter mangrovi]QID17064.1 glucosylglycerol 3-phosphatase [Nitrogeniibacter mangrovi]
MHRPRTAMPAFAYATDHPALLAHLLGRERLLIIQDLDGVCMDLVADPLTRRLELDYLHAARRLAGEFFVLTNGEHIGSRGVNALVERSCGHLDPRAHRLYLPGLAAGGVQFQSADGEVSHPGVSAAELQFLAQVPARARHWLATVLAEAPFALPAGQIATLVDTCVLDNPVSPTLNLNLAFAALHAHPGRYALLQTRTARWCQALLDSATAAGLGESFFVHYAPNLGRDAHGERLKPAEGDSAGTTDFQIMLRGAVKEVGVLVLLNRYYHRLTGHHPLGADFNARTAPTERDRLLALAEAHFDPALMPTLMGVGDTLTASTLDTGTVRGGSDRGFLTLVQDLGVRFGSGNIVAFVDSSGGEIRRPRVATEHLPHAPARALAGISDADDPLMLNAIFPGGYRQYLAFFAQLAARRAPGADWPTPPA